MSEGSSQRDLDRQLEEDLFGFELVEGEPPSAAAPRPASDSAPHTGCDEEVEPLVLPGLLRYYAIWKTRTDSKVRLGVHCCRWTALVDFFPRRKLFGSGVQCKGFDSFDDAVSHNRTSRRIKIDDKWFGDIPIFCEEECNDEYRRARRGD